MVNDKNIVICVGLSGSGINLIRNLLLLDSTFKWPRSTGESDKVGYLKSNVYNVLNLNEWLTHENKTRIGIYNPHLTDLSLFDNPDIIGISRDSKICLITHSTSMARDAQIKYPNIKIISIYADNINAFLWQCRSAIEKLGGLEKIWNYLDVNKDEFLKNHSLEEYYSKNIETMYTVCNYKDQEKQTRNFNCCRIPLSSILELDANFLINKLNNLCDIKLLEGEVFEILNTWMPLHWPIDDTQDYYVFKKYPLNIEQN